MFVISVFLLLLVVIFLIFNKNNDVGKAMAVILFSVVLIGITGTIYLSKTTSYTYTFSLDYKIYLFVSRLKVYFSTICRLFNMSICVFLTGSAMLCTKPPKKILKGILFMLPIAAFMVINDPKFHRYMEIENAVGKAKNIAGLLYKYSPHISVGIIIVYVLMPLITYSISVFREKISLSRKYNFIVLMCIVLVDVFVILGFFYGTLSNVMITNMGIARLPKQISPVKGYYASMIIFLPIFILIISIFWYYKPLLFLNPAKFKRIAEVTAKADNNLYVMLHEIKNNMISIAFRMKIAENSLAEQDYAAAAENLEKGYAAAEEYLERLNEKLKFFADVSGTIDVVNIVDCIKNVASLNYGFPIELECENDVINVFGNQKSLEECFRNIVINAANSLKKANRESPLIKISVMKMERYCSVDFMDNGIGISKKEARNIFRPFYSYMQDKDCSGIGLSYCKNVIEGHNGTITVKSKLDSYADFQIILPVFDGKKRLRERN